MHHRLSLMLLVGSFAATAALADYSTDQIQMAATGRYDLLEKSIEEQARAKPLGTRDQHALCYAYSKTKRYHRLLECLDTLEAKVAQGDRRTRLFGLNDATPAIHIMRAEAHIELGRYAEAVKEAEKTLAWLKDDDSDDFDMWSNAYAALSLAHALGGDEENAWKAEKSLRNIPVGPLSDYANAKAFALARARMGLKDYAGVIDAIRGDRSFAINVFLDRLVSGSFLTGVNNWVWAELPRAFMLNKALLESGQIDEARRGFDRLLEIRQVRENGEIYWLLLADRGRIADGDGRGDEALKHYREAIEQVEQQRASINTEASKIGFVGDKQALYSRAVEAARKLGQDQLAFEFIERAKSRALVDLLAARESTPLAAARNSDSRQKLEKLLAARHAASLQLPVDMSQDGAGKTRQNARQESQDLQQKDPQLASLITVNALSSHEIRELLQGDEVLLEYFGLGDALYLFVLDRQGQALLRLDSPALDAAVREFRHLIQEQAPEARSKGQALYRQLIAPAAARLGQRNLLIVPHGPLHYLPFAALDDGRDVLIAGRSLRFLPSSSVQKYLRPAGRSPLDNLLIYGNPDLGDSRLDLPSAEDEAKSLASLLPKARLLTRKQATETTFKQEAGKFAHLHIASHGQFKSDKALESRLLLARDEANDGSLTVAELYETRLNADLVTLSACETGLGKQLSGDDLIGLTRGFLYAGTSNIVASLWEVDDEATSLLMKDFYSRLKQGNSKREALRQAQLNLRKTHPDPFFWAAFYLTGQGQ